MPPSPRSRQRHPGHLAVHVPRRGTAVISAIVGGSPFARCLTPLPTARTGAVFPLADDVSEPSWGKELDVIPTLDLEGGEYDVAVSRLSGSILISQETIDDADYPLTAQVEQVIQDKFSQQAGPGLHRRRGPRPVPTGILAVAAEVTGADLELAAVAAKGEIGTAGGEADSIAMSPTLIAELESARDEIGRSLYPDAGTTFAGLATVRSVAATHGDRLRLHAAVDRDQPGLQRRVSRETYRGVDEVRAVAADRGPVRAWPRRCRRSRVRKLAVSEPASAGTHAESAKRAARS